MADAHHTLSIEYCEDCPFSRYYGGRCEHEDAPGHDDFAETYGGPPPNWCPLRAEPVTLTVKDGD